MKVVRAWPIVGFALALVVVIAICIAWLGGSTEADGPLTDPARAPTNPEPSASVPQHELLPDPLVVERDAVAIEARGAGEAEEQADDAGDSDGEEQPIVVEGSVVDAEAARVPGATVVFGKIGVQSKEDGSFRLTSEQPWVEVVEFSTALVAFEEAMAPAYREDFGREVLQSRETLHVELRLEAPAAIEGTLLDAEGAAAVGWKLDLLGGVTLPRQLDQFERPRIGGFAPAPKPVPIEAHADRRDEPVVTDELGHFRVGGLTPGRSYRLRIWNERSLEIFETDSILPGSGPQLLRAPWIPRRDRVYGVVQDPSGVPLAGVLCRLTMVEYQVDHGLWMQTGQSMTTSPGGDFAFSNVPCSEGLFIRFKGEKAGGRFDLPGPRAGGTSA